MNGRPSGSGSFPEPRSLTAPNPGPFTLDGTRSHLVGRERVVVVDPGPDDPDHIAALREAVGDGEVTAILLTHGHPDHAAAAPPLREATGAPVAGAVPEVDRRLAAGDAVSSDAGELVAVPTPGHTPDHLSFHWPEAAAVFVGDLLLGEGETTFVGSPEGDVAAYLRSLDRIRELAPRRLHPAHGPAIDDPAAAVERYRRHREERIREVEEVLRRRPDAGPGEVAGAVYGEELGTPLLREAARRSVEAIVAYLEGR